MDQEDFVEHVAGLVRDASFSVIAEEYADALIEEPFNLPKAVRLRNEFLALRRMQRAGQ